MRKIVVLFLASLLAACAGVNPNPGERITDVSWTSGKYIKGWPLVIKRAEEGQPWAQLRMGVFYVYGWGVKRSLTEADKWYARASVQIAQGNWANGVLVGALGKPGYFNQNSDAYMARYNLSYFVFHGQGVKQDKALGYALINSVVKAENGKAIFFCCEFDGGRYISNEAIQKRYKAFRNTMTAKELNQASKMSEEDIVSRLDKIAHG